MAVQQAILRENAHRRIKKIVDFGCGSLNFLPYLKYIYDICEVLCVDVKDYILHRNLSKAQPNLKDTQDKLTKPLSISILHGSVADPDYLLIGSDVVLGIELCVCRCMILLFIYIKHFSIEHLYPDVLEAIPYNIFGYVEPKAVILTTPNADFNVVFPNKRAFRNIDHKFEWSRDQFESW